ncbi:unnamed protein product [Prorocentrum cordatum]|uniref:Kinesin motor domain-containing protein n=1 Tax=Prorocentrum cordatum TaxID=2364126 RepID=A0ABN9TIQ2_9DINO|nr:unnamed protein product [Polarella glacialis]
MSQSGRGSTLSASGAQVAPCKAHVGEAITVGVRLRPLLPHEQGQQPVLKVESDNVVSVVIGNGVKHIGPSRFQFDHAMDSTDPASPSHVSAAKCYDLMGRRMLEHMMLGYNTCLFCYGQTGTGKTTTIMGSAFPVEEQGILLRLITELFAEVARLRAEGSEVSVQLQMLEVYNEKLSDLLVPREVSISRRNSFHAAGHAVGKADSFKKIDVHVHPEFGVYLTGATELMVDSAEKCARSIEFGNSMKTVYATAMNSQSSRGHTVVKLSVERKGGNDNMVLRSEVYFADLAGRENEKTTQVTGDRLVELTFINRSLLQLANCIQGLGREGMAQASRRRPSRKHPASAPEWPEDHQEHLDHGGPQGRRDTKGHKDQHDHEDHAPHPGHQHQRDHPDRRDHAPYSGQHHRKGTRDFSLFRNSKLTLLLSNALSGNSRTAMIGTLSPAIGHFEESYSTLRFAVTVGAIKVEAIKSSEQDYPSLVKKLQGEVADLRAQLSAANANVQLNPSLMPVETRARAREELVDELTKDPEDSRRASKNREPPMRHAMLQHGAAEFSQVPLPHLVGSSDDPSEIGAVVYHIPPDNAEHSLGADDSNDLRLPPRAGVPPRACTLRNDGRSVWIRLARGAEGREHPEAADVRVDGVRLGTEAAQVGHLSCLHFGPAVTLCLCTERTSRDDIVSCTWHESPADPSIEELVSLLLGDERADRREQLGQAARRCLRDACRAQGPQAVRSLLERARDARTWSLARTAPRRRLARAPACASSWPLTPRGRRGAPAPRGRS